MSNEKFYEDSGYVYVPQWLEGSADELGEIGCVTLPTSDFSGTTFLLPQGWIDNDLGASLAVICAFAEDQGWDGCYTSPAEHDAAIAEGDSPEWFTELWTEDGRQFFLSEMQMHGLRITPLDEEKEHLPAGMLSRIQRDIGDDDADAYHGDSREIVNAVEQALENEGFGVHSYQENESIFLEVDFHDADSGTYDMLSVELYADEATSPYAWHEAFSSAVESWFEPSFLEDASFTLTREQAEAIRDNVLSPMIDVAHRAVLQEANGNDNRPCQNVADLEDVAKEHAAVPSQDAPSFGDDAR